MPKLTKIASNLAKSFINGNKNSVLLELESLSKRDAIIVTSLLVSKLRKFSSGKERYDLDFQNYLKSFSSD